MTELLRESILVVVTGDCNSDVQKRYGISSNVEVELFPEYLTIYLLKRIFGYKTLRGTCSLSNITSFQINPNIWRYLQALPEPLK